MLIDQPQSVLYRLLNTATFPFRGLLLHEESLGPLTSLRDERMRAVATFCHGRVLDVGCGPKNCFIERCIGHENGVGIDVYAYEGVEHVIPDMTRLPFENGTFDTVTLIAVGGHIPKSVRVAEFAEFARILKKDGHLVMTEGEPITQYLVHKWVRFLYALQGREDVDTERGMVEGEEYCMSRREIIHLLNTPPLRFQARKRFMWGLNNIYVAVRE